MGYRILRTLLLTLILGVFTALSAQNEPAARASYGDYLIMGLVHRGDLPVNPFRITSLAEKEIAQLIFGYGLTKTPDKYGSPPPLIGPPINKPEDSKYRIWEFALARGVSFHDGSEFRNKDVIFTFSFLKKFGGYLFNRNLDFRNVLRISPGQGDLEVVFELRDPDPDFLRKLADIPILPEKYYAEAMAVGHAAFAVQPPIGMGPFRLDIQTPTEIVMVHHPFYHAGRPFLDGVRVILFEDEQELLDALVEGRIDYLELPDPGTARRLHSLLRKRIGIFPVPRHEQTVTTLLFNVNHGPLASIPVRQAIDMALNRQTMVDRFMPDYAEPAYSLLGSDDPHFYKKISTKKFNPRLAQELLAKEGWVVDPRTGILTRDGVALSFKLYFSRNSSLEESLVRTIKLELGELKINVEPVPIPNFRKAAHLAQNDYQAMLYEYAFLPDYLLEGFSNFYGEALGGRSSHRNYRNRYMDRLFEMLQQGKTSPDRIYQRLQMFMETERPAIFLFFNKTILVALDQRFEQYRSAFREGTRQYARMNPIENWFVPRDKQKY